MLAFKLLFTKLENRNVRKVIPLEGQRHKTNIYIYWLEKHAIEN